jgi:outer membrane protein assembly factor BamB/ABC-type phosphate/phosphonate transport system substrate-binding protein
MHLFHPAVRKAAMAAVAVAIFAALSPQPRASAGDAAEPFSLVVMDPLAAPLSCPCVAGYAQRKYEVLAEHIEKAIGRPVVLTFSESLTKALQKEGCTTAHLIIGKDSVVRADAAKHKFKATPLAQLTGLDGKTTQTGLIVVPSADPAQSVADLKGYRIIFGPGDCSEKSSAARELLESAGVELPPPDKVEVSEACSDGACAIIEWGPDVRGAAVISSYAAPLLEGCGTIKKGDLRVVAETEPVPFVTAFVTDKTSANDRKRVEQLLLDSASEPELLTALETMLGFVELDDDYPREKTESNANDAKATKNRSNQPVKTTLPAKPKSAASWPGWRGLNRDGRSPQLPATLSTAPNIIWRQPLHHAGLGGIAANDQYVVIGDRDATNQFDVWRCYDADDGEELWTVQYPAGGKLDYDNTPRASPQIWEDLVFVCGAFGDVRCIDLASGAVLWQKNIRQEFGAEDELVWGACASPLVVDEMVILHPGAPEASLVALDAYSGETIWQAAGGIHAFASPILATLGGVRQIVAFDRRSVAGHDIATGRRLWTLEPPIAGGFHVPTPVVVGDKLLIAGETYGARLYQFDEHGHARPKPVADSTKLRPDMSTPVAVGDRVFCVCGKLYALDASTLQPVWIGRDEALSDYGPIIASDDRLLIYGRGGELLLVDALADEFKVLSRQSVFDGPQDRQVDPFSHPAIVGSRLYLRGPRELVCLDLGTPPGTAKTAAAAAVQTGP